MFAFATYSLMFQLMYALGGKFQGFWGKDQGSLLILPQALAIFGKFGETEFNLNMTPLFINGKYTRELQYDEVSDIAITCLPWLSYGQVVGQSITSIVDPLHGAIVFDPTYIWLGIPKPIYMALYGTINGKAYDIQFTPLTITGKVQNENGSYDPIMLTFGV